MPKKINVVSLSDVKPVEEDEPISNDELNQIKDAIKEEEKLQPSENTVVDEVSKISNDKPKPKRKPPVKKPKVIEESPPIKGADKTEQSSVESPKEESPKDESLKDEPPQETPKKTKTIEQVECPKCHKLMSRRTLRYDHDKTCPGEKIDREKIPVKKRIKKEVVKHIESPSTTLNVPEEIIEQLPQGVLGRDVEHLVELEVKKRIQNTVNEKINQRIKQKEEKIKKLAAQIV